MLWDLFRGKHACVRVNEMIFLRLQCTSIPCHGDYDTNRAPRVKMFVHQTRMNKVAAHTVCSVQS